MKFLGEYVRTTRALSPQIISTSTTVNGVIIDRLGFEGAVVTAITGETTGTITACTFKLQHGDTANGSDMTDVAGATVSVTAADSTGEINVNLIGLKRYIRVVVTTTLSGTSPSIAVGATITLGNPKLLPI